MNTPAKKAVGIIPARWTSSRFPGKPLHLIAGRPLLRHVWERTKQARTLDRVIIATDNFRIAEAAFNWGAEVALTSSTHPSGTDRVAEVAKKARQFAHIVNIQGDEPLIDPKLIDQLVRELRRNPELEIVTAAHPFRDLRETESPHQVKVVIDRDGFALYFSRAQIPALREEAGRPRAEASKARAGLFLRHQGIYGYTRSALLRFVRWRATPLERAEALEQLRALENGVRIKVVVTKGGSPGVDTPEDTRMIERLIMLADQRRPGFRR